MMNIERVNAVLNMAILGLQDDELEGMFEAMAGGYRVPTPKSMGFKIKRPKKPESKWKTKKLKMVTKSRQPWIPDEHHDVRVYSLGVWGVYKEPGTNLTYWKVVHLPSGSEVNFGGYTGNNYKRKIDAQKAVEAWVSAIPELLDARAAGLLVKHKRAMHDIAVNITNPPKPEPSRPPEKDHKEELDVTMLKRAMASAMIKADRGGPPSWRMHNHLERLMLRDGRYHDLVKRVPSKIFSRALKELESEGHVKRASMDGHPVVKWIGHPAGLR